MTRQGAALDLLIALVLVGCGAAVAPLALHFTRTAFLNFGPNDQDYVRNFRSDWEPEGRTRFHWTDVRAAVHLPLHVSGAGHVLRLRVRRHFLEPAQVTLRVEGRRVGEFEVSALDSVAWRVVEFPLPRLEGRGPFQLEIEAPSANPRPLGVALDWMELERGAAGAFSFLPETRWRLALVLLAAFVALRLTGLPRAWAAGCAAALAGAASFGLARDGLAAERVLRQGSLAFVVVAFLASLVRLPWVRRVLRVDGPGAAPRDPRWAGLLVALALAAFAVRLVLLLHPQFYYPDVRIHAVFARELAKLGLGPFLQDFTAAQYRFSLGLQFENGHWYAFPYPPAFYVLCWPLVRLAHMAPDVAVAVLAAAVNSLEALVVFAIGRRLHPRRAVALVAAALVPLLPIFVTRLSLAYFPALVGHAVDAVVMLYLLSRLRRLAEPRVVLTLALLLAAALLTYTQSLLNWGVLLPLYLLVWVGRERSREARRGQLGLAAAGALGVVLSLGFYGRYIPIFIDMQRGVPMPEEQVLLDKLTRTAATPAGRAALAQTEEPDDPFAAPNVSPWRGVRKAAWRLYLFYGVFALAVVAGLVGVWRAAPAPEIRRLVAVWASLYLLLNLASGGLPGPNLVRYNKDLEVVAPLFCVALAYVMLALWDRWRPMGVALALSFQGFAAWRALHALTDKFFAVR